MGLLKFKRTLRTVRSEIDESYQSCLFGKKKAPKIWRECTAPQKLDIKNLTFGVFFNEINL